MRIKTIWHRADYPAGFDDKVNAAMTAGWKLTRRDLVCPQSTDKYIMLYAELVELDPADELNPTPEPPTWEEAVETLANFCKARDNCSGCPALHWCNKAITDGALSPAEWPDPCEGAEA